MPDSSPRGNYFKEISMPLIQFLNADIYFQFIKQNKY